ncbi:MAG: hypothetical protein DLM70_08510 [Chloroflexi bacterium]|nr:MAG: hypothetical protein DLM70_08510 [Chloroflexota bacterium]
MFHRVVLILSLLLPMIFASAAVASPMHTPVNPIQRENARKGSTGWAVTTAASAGSLSGYGSSTSVQAGSSIGFSVSTTAPRFRADIYRLGWYGGAGGRLMRSFPRLAGHHWSVPAPDPVTGLVACHWPPAFSIVIPSTWVSGVYLARLALLDGHWAFIPFVVRARSNVSRFLLIRAVATEQAYNPWGGKSLYAGIGSHVPAVKVSFARPLANAYGAGELFAWEYPTLSWLERNGYDVSYATDVDVHEHSSLLLHRKGILIAGHDEYWSKQMRDGMDRAVAHGVNLAVLSANAAYTQIRFGPLDGHPDRVIVCYRSAVRDPLTGIHNERLTVNWRDPPVRQPESLLLGAMYGDYNLGHHYPMVVTSPHSWVFAGTGLQRGSTITGLVGSEWDHRVVPGYPVPDHMVVLARSPVIGTSGERTLSNATISEFPSGASVFDAGTLNWSAALGFSNRTGRLVRTITETLLRHFGSAP